jgi:hypothetical protein
LSIACNAPARASGAAAPRDIAVVNDVLVNDVLVNDVLVNVVPRSALNVANRALSGMLSSIPHLICPIRIANIFVYR